MSGIVICSIFGTDSFQLIAFTKVLPLDSGRVRGREERDESLANIFGGQFRVSQAAGVSSATRLIGEVASPVSIEATPDLR